LHISSYFGVTLQLQDLARIVVTKVGGTAE